MDAALDWVATRPELAGPLLLHGDSAGGNLALVAALRHPERVTALALVYPFLDPTAGFGSYQPTPTGSPPTRRPGTGTSTPALPPTATTRTSLRCCPAASVTFRRRWW